MRFTSLSVQHDLYRPRHVPAKERVREDGVPLLYRRVHPRLALLSAPLD